MCSCGHSHEEHNWLGACDWCGCDEFQPVTNDEEAALREEPD